MVRAGKVRYVGCSNFLAYRLARAIGRSEARQLVRFESVQPRYNLLFREIERELLPLCEEERVGVIPYNPIAGGMLTGKHVRDAPRQRAPASRSARAGSMYQERYWHDREFDTVEALRRLADEAGLPLATLAVALGAGQPGDHVGRSSVPAGPSSSTDTVAAADKALDPALQGPARRPHHGVPLRRRGALDGRPWTSRSTACGVRIDEPMLADVAAATDEALAGSGVTFARGDEVAIAVGSRGLHDLAVVVGRVAAWVRDQGAVPFLVPAMGSHGGATADGQQAVLESYGLGAGEVGARIRSSMDVVALPRGDCPVPVVTDAIAARAAATVVVNRVKPHTDFHGPYESGLMKMVAIGLGKRVQAEALHAHGTRGLRELMPAVARQVLAHGNVVLGVAIVENGRERTMAIEAVPAAGIPDAEPALLALAAEHLARLPVDALDVLLVDRMGKDISGVGMDTNVIGRTMIAGEDDPPSPRIGMIACHELTPASHGNATGMGLADIVTRRLADAVDHDVTRTNVVTSGFLLRGKLPVVADDDRQAWEWSLRGAGVVDPRSVRAARIVDTLRCRDLWVTDAVLAELAGDRRVAVLARSLPLHGGDGRLTPFDGT